MPKITSILALSADMLDDNLTEFMKRGGKE